MAQIQFVHADDGGHRNIDEYGVPTDTDTAVALAHFLRQCHRDGPKRTHIVHIRTDGVRRRALINVTQFEINENADAPPKNTYGVEGGT